MWGYWFQRLLKDQQRNNQWYFKYRIESISATFNPIADNHQDLSQTANSQATLEVTPYEHRSRASEPNLIFFFQQYTSAEENPQLPLTCT